MQLSLQNIEAQKSNSVFRLNFSNPNMVSIWIIYIYGYWIYICCRGDNSIF